MLLKPLMVGKAAVAAFHNKVKAFFGSEIPAVHCTPHIFRVKCCNSSSDVGVKCNKSNYYYEVFWNSRQSALKLGAYGIYAHLPDVKLYLLAYYPVNPSAATDPGMQEVLTWRTNDRIRSANAAVEKLAAETGAAFIDLNAGITDQNGELKAEYTIDGMHMYADGYMEVLKALLVNLPAI